MPAFKDLTGQRFGRLVALEPIRGSRNNPPKYICKCDCGNIVTVRSCHIVSGHTKSCGCYNSDVVKEMKTTHGQCHTRLYRIWFGMLGRCTKESNEAYHNYGGRGITVCDEWRKFEPFYEWSMKNGYTDELTLDRIDVNGNYEPSNCRWATRYEQSRNTRRNVVITFNNETKILRDWEIELGMNPGTLEARINDYGWSVEKAFTTPVRNRTKKNCIDNQNKEE